MKSKCLTISFTSYPISMRLLPAATAADIISGRAFSSSMSSLSTAFLNSLTSFVKFGLSSGTPPLSAGNSQSYLKNIQFFLIFFTIMTFK